MKRKRFGFEAWTAIFLSVVLALTSFDFSVYAEGLSNGEMNTEFPGEENGESAETEEDGEDGETQEAPDDDGGELPEAPGEGEGDTPPESDSPGEEEEQESREDPDDENSEDSPNPDEETDSDETDEEDDGAVVVICGFEPLAEEEARIRLTEKISLDALTARMPQELSAYTYDTQTDSGADGEAPVKSAVTVYVEEWVCDEDYEGTELDSYLFRPQWDVSRYDYQEADGDAAPPVIQVTIGGETSSPGEPVIFFGFVPLSEKEANIRLREKVALEDLLALMPEELSAYAYEEETDAQTGEVSCVKTFLTVEVEWDCEQDYDGTELESYTFLPSWDTARYVYQEGEAAQDAGTGTEAGEALPAVTVTFLDDADGIPVATQEELARALHTTTDGRIVLAGDIPLTMTLTVPASADIELDGQGFSLLRGQDEGEQFGGVMLLLEEGEEDAAQGALTLTDIQINGETVNDRACAPAVMDYGCLFLGEGASILNNYNYGTYTAQETVLDHGGAIQVFGELTLLEGSLITGNFADELGGGVYLASGATLYLHDDVITGNLVGASGSGADLYASNGSTIFYHPSINMERDTFYICPNATLIVLGAVRQYAEQTDSNIEIFLNVGEESGYTTDEIERLRAGLDALPNVTVLSSRKNIDTTDLRNWYVYDHYDTSLWGADGDGDGIPDLWEAAYWDSPKRPYYPYTETYYANTYVDTIEDWLKTSGTNSLARFKEHICTRVEDGRPEMTFVGYGIPNYVDFLFYDPDADSSVSKVVEFEVDSSKVNTHTLAGTGFLVNTALRGGLKSGQLDGYLVYYTYTANSTNAKQIILYQLDGVSVEALHNSVGTLYEGNVIDNSLLATGTIKKVDAQAITAWSPRMSIKITATPTQIQVEQHPADDDGAAAAATYTWSIEETRYDGFGPLVAYAKHNCSLASSFTYSDLHMYYVESDMTRNTLLRPLEEADFTQEGTQRYFLNLLGSSELQYNDAIGVGDQYLNYLKLMQMEGVALITDREGTPFAAYLGSNLCELPGGGGKLLSVDEVVSGISAYIGGKKNTIWNPEEDSENPLTEAAPAFPVGNIYLTYEGGRQIRESLNGSDRRKIVIHDIAYKPSAGGGTTLTMLAGDSDAPDVPEDPAPAFSAKYELLVPDGDGYYTPDDLQVTAEGASFYAGGSAEEWPAGQYTVRQTFDDDSVAGYAYFTLWQPEEKNPVPQTPMPHVPAAQPGDPGEPGQFEAVSADYAAGRPLLIAVPPIDPAGIPVPEASVETPAIDVPQQPVSDAADQPKTADTRIPPMPIATGACTVFMLKIILWMYELELGITDEKKTEMVRALIDWAKGTTKPRIYLAIVAIAIVLTVYHLWKALAENGRRVVKQRIGR